ncbi:hypothetical protein E3U55_16350 [Filobacillus milosensis]|uniref:Uncharacterized protein n=1 Tax=Filobacillus milosensis TaxID=94137 RepID=A0A4Y8IDV2_9BACI|nr:hypothetical protein [Filobacillus milosensis]TFB13301.1 hypothetical protein E3U55_16350 [Filobacillus milosensis]
MINFGKDIFSNNLVQFLLIGLSLCMAILAQQLSAGVADMSLSTFISKSFKYLFNSSNEFSVLVNAFLPGIMYILSCIGLLWMGITNMIMFKLEERKLDVGLKFILGLSQIILFGLFFYTGGKLFFYFISFALSIIFLVALFTSGSPTNQEHN